MATYSANIAGTTDGQDMYGSGNRNTSSPLTFGYVGWLSTDYRIACRWQPDIDLTGHRIIVDSVTMTVRAANGNGDGAFTSSVHIHNGDAPNLSTTDLAFGYSDIGNSQNVSVLSSHNQNDTLTSPDMKAAVQAWFNRAGYAADDYIGWIWEDGDAAKGEYWDSYAGGDTATNRPKMDMTYRRPSKANWNGVANANLELQGVDSDYLSRLQ
ncbi:MAG: hypothetical protein GY854_02350 [Deltaproteobacteria bacterium]|nr:hypothetical protein [Deltaproteobacteria bacterium]